MGDDPKDVVRHDPNRLKGMRMRDEFVCPITCTLMREPTVAADGNTYEKTAIEKWLRNSNKSPRTGETMEGTLIPNLNLKRLIHDIVQEGGAGFYCKDIVDQDRLFEVSREKLLVLECLGPPESDWNQQTFEVTSHGVVGGRRSNLDEGNQQRDVMLFRDIMVSRRHFEITKGPDPSSSMGFSFFIRDLGSAGGTYIRISAGKRKQLQIGMIILLGKHQFTVSSIDDNLEQESHKTTETVPMVAGATANLSITAQTRKSALASDMLRLVANAERIIDGMSSAAQQTSVSSGKSGHVDVQKNSNATSGGVMAGEEELSRQLQHLRLELDHLKQDEALNSCLQLDADADDKAEHYHPAGDAQNNHFQPLKTTANSNQQRFGFTTEDIAQSDCDRKDAVSSAAAAALNMTALEHPEPSDDNLAEDLHSPANPHRQVKRGASFRLRRCVLTCCGPDGSPLQGKAYTVTTSGGTLGRKQTNTIATLIKIKDTRTGEEKFASVDSAISSEHARIDFDPSDGHFYISDGVVPGRASTNGTWYRLSGPHQESPPHLLQAGMEVLIGNIRFLCKETMTIAERKLDGQNK